MKKTTRIFSLLLAVCMLISLFPAALAADRVELNPLTADTQGIQNVETTEPEMEEAPEEESNTPIMNTPLDEDTTNALIDNMPQLVDDEVTVVAEEIENPGVDLTLDTGKVNEIERNTPAPDEIVRVIVVLEDKGLLEQGFTTAQIASNTAKVERQVETLAKRQDAAIAAINRVVEEPVEAKYRYNVALNGLAVEVPYGDLAEIKELPNVKTAFVAPQYEAPVDMSDEVANPNMYAAKDTVGAPQTWEELGYTGTGMRIAIIDSGLDTDHPAFQAAPPLTEDSLTLSEVASVMKSLNAYQQYMSHTSKELTADRLYRSEKVPFGFNYCDDNLELNHDNPSAYDHGSHVAGIAAANAVEGSDVVGVAPDAQILVFKVFGKAGGAYFDDIMAALEDTFRLNADAVNMSLGSAAGFVDEDDYTTHIFKQIMDSDMVVAISAGNSFSAAYMNAYGTNLNLTKDPDIGLVGSPGTYMGATTVASMENGYLMSTYFEVGEHKLTYHDAASIPFTTLAGKELSYVMVPGYGTVEDFEGLDLTGKIAVVKRGSSDPNAPVSFVDKQQNAANAGAVAVIVYDNVEGTLGYMMDAGVIPNVMITMADGATLAAEAKNGEGTMRIHGADDLITVESPEAGLMSSFSSWGVTPDLQLEPDITAPGGNIYSTVDGGGYGTKSGTSMASPAVAGMSALILQHIRDTYNDLYEDEVHALAESLLMSTAEPVLEVTGIPASPRKQGAGSANVYRAISTPGYLTVNGVTPKVSFGDDDLRAGVYNFSFEINNRSDSPLTYVLDGTVLTDQVNLDYAQLGYYFMSETSRELGASVDFTMKNGVIPTEYDYNVDGETDLRDVQALLDAVNGLSAVKAGYDLNGDGKTDTADAQALYEMIQEGFTALNVVEVPANSSVRVYATVTLTDEDKAYMDEYYENGIYVDGFVRCYAQDEGGVDLSLPFMGFYGDWSDARVFDEGWFTDKDVEHNRFYNVFFTQAAGQEFYLGWNPYLTEKYDSFHNVLSPNGDGTLDSIVEIYLCLMRNAKGVRMNISDVNTGASLYQFAAKYVRKSVYYAAANVCLPMIFSDYGRLYDFADVENNDELELTLDAYLDDGDFNVDESYSLPIYIDTEKPVLYTDSLTYDYDPITDTRKIGFDVSDNHGIAAVISMTAGNGIYERIAMEDKPGERMHVELDVSDYDASFTIAVCDYGCNEAYYNITFYGQENLSTEDFYGYRLSALVPVSEKESVLTAVYNGWNSFADGSQMFQHTAATMDKQPDVYAAEYVDGYIIGIDTRSNIFTMKAGDWTRTIIGKLEIDGEVYPALDMAFDYTTNTLFVLTDEPDRSFPQHLVKVDYLTGEVTDVGVLTDDRNYGDVGITLACDNDGNLYTVYALTHTLEVCDGGALYTIDKETAYATRVGNTGIYPYYTQSMTVDHKTNKLYWASYQNNSGAAESGVEFNGLYEINKETGERTLVSRMMYDDAIAGLFKVYHPETPLFPADAALTGLQLSSNDLVIKLGRTAELTCRPLPYYAELGEVTWTSSDKSVATVENGVITAVGQGEAVITAACGNVTATCAVTVMDFSGEVRLYNTVANRWISLDISDVSKTTILEDAVQFPFGFTNAGYYDGTVIATDYLSGFYRLDAETLQGEQVSSTMSNLHGFAMNYQDGFIYAMGGPHLYRVNPYSGQTQDMGRIFVQGSPVGGFTIDRNGNAYVVMRSYDEKTTSLCKFPIDASGAPGDVEEYVLQDYPIRMYDGSLVYSEENHGLLWSNDYGRLLWMDPSDMENVRIADLGVIGKSTLDNGMAMNVCLHEIPADEPDVKYAPVSNASIKDTYTMVEGGTALVGLSCTPWNAKLVATYTTDNPRIATVDKSGHITGLSTGTTTLRVNVEGLSKELTATVNVIETAGDIYGYMLGNYMYDFGKWIRFHDYDPSEYEILAATPNFYQVRAGAYYDGYIYAYCATEGDEDYKRSIVKIDAGDYSRETLAFSEYQLRDLEFDYTTGTLYGVAERIFGNNEKDYALIQIDTRTGEEFLVGSTGHDLVAFTIDDQGRLFGLNQSGQFCQIDKETGKATVVASIGAYVGSTWQCMYFDHNTGNTYWPQPNEGGKLYTIDLETGKTNPVGTIGKLGMQMSAMFTIPEEEIPVPATMEPTGVKLDEKNVVSVGGTVELSGRALPMTVCDMDGTLTWTSDNASVATVKDGVVTGVSVGTATITATTVNGLSAQCTITVLDHAPRFYSYDQDNCRWISFSKDDPTDYKIEREDAEGESRIFASTLVGDTIYAFDEHMCFYTIDPDTFERTLVSDAHKDMTYNYTIPGGNNYDLTMMPIDLSYDPSNGKLYVAIVGYVVGMYEANPDQISGLCSLFYEVNMETGALGNRGNEKPNYRDDTVHVTNLLAENGKLYFVDGFLSGMFRYADLNRWQTVQDALIVQYWGRFMHSRGMVRDPYTGEVYALYDNDPTPGGNDGGHCRLVRLATNNPDATFYGGFIAEGSVLNGLFIR